MEFFAGLRFDNDGVEYRVLRGNRCEGDLVIEFRVPTGWHRPSIAHTQILAEFKYKVEEKNYGPDGGVRRGRGGHYLLAAIRDACTGGWEAAAERTRKQREDADRRRESDARQGNFLSARRARRSRIREDA